MPVAGLNDADIIPLAALAHEHAIAVRFIELMPLGRAAAWRGITGTQVLDTLAARFGQPERAPAPPVGNGPAVYYTFPRFRGTIGIIGAISSPFCEHCNRLRLSAAGLLSPCLSGAAHIDIRPLLRTGSANNAADDLALETAFKQAVRAKPAAHTFAPDSHTNHGDKAMWNIGG